MGTYWRTMLGVASALVVVGVLLGTASESYNPGGEACGAPFVSTADERGDSSPSESCSGARAQARQLPLAMVLLGGAGLGAVVVERMRARIRRLEREREAAGAAT